MVDMGKKITKHCSDQLLPGETIAAGTFGQPLGAFAKGVAFGAVGGAVGALAGEAMAKRASKDQSDAEGAQAATIPAGKAVIGVSDHRLLFFEHGTMSGRPKALTASFALSDLSGFEADEGRVKTEMTFVFRDGSSRTFEVVKGAKPGAFVEAMRARVG
jgi:hypothetical protein